MEPIWEGGRLFGGEDLFFFSLPPVFEGAAVRILEVSLLSSFQERFLLLLAVSCSGSARDAKIVPTASTLQRTVFVLLVLLPAAVLMLARSLALLAEELPPIGFVASVLLLLAVFFPGSFNEDLPAVSA